VNGWSNTIFGTTPAAVGIVSGIVTFRGAISTSGTNPVATVLPAAYRPPTAVYVPVDLCGATKGRLIITPDGTVTVQPKGAFTTASCFTSLEGASFAVSGVFTGLSLQNGWTNAPFSTRNAAVTLDAGIVHMEGAIATAGTNAIPFVLPPGFRPSTQVYVPVDLCSANNGRLNIATDGTVTVQAEGGTFTNASCFTSLEGVSFAVSTSNFTPLTLVNGWTNAPFSTRNAGAFTDKHMVRLEGAIATSGTNAVPFTLPPEFRPPSVVYAPVDMCSATNGRLIISTDGTVSVQAETAFSNASCFTSLESVAYSL
jgi:hypothetical protein